MSVTHVLKTLDCYWDAVECGAKKFEVRKNDRGFQPGDTVVLQRWHTHPITKNYRKDSAVEPLKFKIGWMLQGGQFGIECGYCVFSLEPLEDES